MILTLANLVHALRVLLTGIAIHTVALAQTTPLDPQRTFDPDRVVQVEIELPATDWDALRRQTRAFATLFGSAPPVSPFTDFAARVTVDGVRFDGARVRKKGFLGSLSAERPSLKINLGKPEGDAPAAGLDRLTLNNNLQDTSLLSQRLTYRTFAAAGLAAPRCNFAEVKVNGESLGIYTHVESIAAPMLARVFGDGSGELWEGTVADLFVDSLARFEPKTASAQDRAPLQRLATALAREPLDLDEIDKLLDVNAFLAFWATETLLGVWDGYTNNQNNYFVYKSPKNAKLYFIPWGADHALTGRMPLPPYVIKTKAVHSQAVLAHRLYRLPAIQQRYREVLEGLLQTVWNEDELRAEIARVEKLVAGRLSPGQARRFADAVAAHAKFIDGRRASMARHLKSWPVELESGPRQPAYSAPFGSGSGSFATTWTNEDPKAAEAASQATLALTIRGEVTELERLVAHAKLSESPVADGPVPPTVVFTGVRKSDGETVFLAIGTSVEDFRPTAGEWVELGGVLIEGKLGWLDPKAWRFVSGQAKFEHAAMTKGAVVQGELRVDIVELRGGEPKSEHK